MNRHLNEAHRFQTQVKSTIRSDAVSQTMPLFSNHSQSDMNSLKCTITSTRSNRRFRLKSPASNLWPNNSGNAITTFQFYWFSMFRGVTRPHDVQTLSCRQTVGSRCLVRGNDHFWSLSISMSWSDVLKRLSTLTEFPKSRQRTPTSFIFPELTGNFFYSKTSILNPKTMIAHSNKPFINGNNQNVTNISDDLCSRIGAVIHEANRPNGNCRSFNEKNTISI